MVQELPLVGGTEVPTEQVEDGWIVKSPGSAPAIRMLEMFTATVPRFVSTALWGELAVPMPCEPKFSAVGAS